MSTHNRAYSASTASPVSSVTTDSECQENIDVIEDDSGVPYNVLADRSSADNDDGLFTKSAASIDEGYRSMFDVSSDSGNQQRKLGHRGFSSEELRVLRSKINSRERKRMHDLNSAMDSLRDVMPYAKGPSVRKLSKMATLTLARNYIQMLSKSVEEMKQLLDDIYRSGGPAHPVPHSRMYPQPYLTSHPHHISVVPQLPVQASSQIQASTVTLSPPYSQGQLLPNHHHPSTIPPPPLLPPCSLQSVSLAQHPSELIPQPSSSTTTGHASPSAQSLISRVRPSSYFQPITCSCPGINAYPTILHARSASDNAGTYIDGKRSNHKLP